MAHLTKIDQSGRITLPQQALDTLGLSPDEEVILEWTESAIVIKSRSQVHPITDSIARMNLPVADWEQMEEESTTRD